MSKRMRTVNTVILVLGCSKPQFKELEEAIRQTWGSIHHPDTEIVFYIDNENQSTKLNHQYYDETHLIQPYCSGLNEIGYRTIEAFEWVNNNYNYKYIYRSNLGAYINQDNLIKFLSNKPTKGFYCGIYGDNYGFTYASGSGYFLSKDVVQLILDNKDKWDHSLIDDVSLGKLLSSMCVYPTDDALRFNLCDNRVFYQKGKDITIPHIPDDEIYHTRLRSGNRQLDIDRMKEIHDSLKSQKP